MRVIHHAITEIVRRPPHPRAVRARTAISVHAHEARRESDHLLGAVAHEVEHVEDVVREEQLPRAVATQVEPVPEELLAAIAAPVALHEHWISIQRQRWPLRYQSQRRIEPPDLG